MDGYLAMVQVRGLTRGHTVRFAMQVACVPATIVVVYAAHAVLLGADGTSWWGAPCPAGTTPAGGGTAVTDPPMENVAEAGFHSTAGRFDGYQAAVQVRGLPRRAQLPFAVQVACLSAAAPPADGPPAKVAAAVTRLGAISRLWLPDRVIDRCRATMWRRWSQLGPGHETGGRARTPTATVVAWDLRPYLLSPQPDLMGTDPGCRSFGARR